MKTSRKIMAVLTITLLMQSCMVANRSQTYDRTMFDRQVECYGQKQTQRERNKRLVMFTFIIPALIWIVLPKP